MDFKLTVDDDFYTTLTERLWKSNVDAVRELLENSYDADASKVLITFLDNGLSIEDDAGMDEARVKKFLKVGGLHDEGAEITKGGRMVIGKYRVGRLSALGVFNRMQVRTRLGGFGASFVITFDDLKKLAKGRAALDQGGLPRLRRSGTEILLLEPKSNLDFEGVRKVMEQLPILRTPGFEVHMKKSNELREWNFEGAARILAKDVRGLKIPVKVERVFDPSKIDGTLRVEGVITIADDSALPLAEEEKGIGIVVSAHLVTRSYFGFENSPYRFDRVTGYVECTGLKTTFGAKDRLVEDENLGRFVAEMKLFLKDVVVPRLQEAEIRLVGRAEMKLLRRVDRKLGSALAELPLESFKPGGERIPPEALRSVMPQDKVLRQTTESSMVVIEEPGDASQPSAGASIEPRLREASQEPTSITEGPTHAEVDWTQPSKEPAQASQLSAPVATPPDATSVEGAESQAPSPPPVPRRRLGHFLHDLGVVVIPYDGRDDARPSYGIKEYALGGFKVRAIFVNRKHPSYVKCEKEGTLVDHLLRLITNELVGMSYEGSETAMGVANRLYGIAVAKG